MTSMKLRSGASVWLDTLPELPPYRALTEDITCDALVIGGGESGASCAYELQQQGVDTVLVDQSTIGSGSTSANTGLLQFTNDKTLTACMNTFGAEAGARFYKLCLEAIDRLEQLSSRLAFDPQFKRRTSLYFASVPEDVPGLREEYAALKSQGFDVEYWEPDRISRSFSFTKPGAIYAQGDAEINPYRYANAAVRTASQQGLRVYEHTEISRHEADANGITFITTGGHRIRARHAVIATGYETQTMKRNPNAVLSSSYAIATEPLREFPGWLERCLIWETARPYLYIRTTADNRIIAGGLDEQTINVEERERMLRAKGTQLLDAVRSLFPSADIRPAYAWAATFGSTHDGLPLIGQQEQYPHCYFALGYGGNGTVYSAISAQIISSLIVRGSHPDADLFRFDRPTAHNKTAVLQP